MYSSIVSQRASCKRSAMPRLEGGRIEADMIQGQHGPVAFIDPEAREQTRRTTGTSRDGGRTQRVDAPRAVDSRVARETAFGVRYRSNSPLTSVTASISYHTTLSDELQSLRCMTAMAQSFDL